MPKIATGRVEPASKFHELEKAKKWAGPRVGQRADGWRFITRFVYFWWRRALLSSRVSATNGRRIRVGRAWGVLDLDLTGTRSWGFVVEVLVGLWKVSLRDKGFSDFVLMCGFEGFFECWVLVFSLFYEFEVYFYCISCGRTRCCKVQKYKNLSKKAT